MLSLDGLLREMCTAAETICGGVCYEICLCRYVRYMAGTRIRLKMQYSRRQMGKAPTTFFPKESKSK